jgi:hypothetical protein
MRPYLRKSFVEWCHKLSPKVLQEQVDLVNSPSQQGKNFQYNREIPPRFIKYDFGLIETSNR